MSSIEILLTSLYLAFLVYLACLRVVLEQLSRFGFFVSGKGMLNPSVNFLLWLAMVTDTKHNKYTCPIKYKLEHKLIIFYDWRYKFNPEQQRHCEKYHNILKIVVWVVLHVNFTFAFYVLYARFARVMQVSLLKICIILWYCVGSRNAQKIYFSTISRKISPFLFNDYCLIKKNTLSLSYNVKPYKRGENNF